MIFYFVDFDVKCLNQRVSNAILSGFFKFNEESETGRVYSILYKMKISMDRKVLLYFLT